MTTASTHNTKHLVQSLFTTLKENGWAVQCVMPVLRGKTMVEVNSPGEAIQLIMGLDIAEVGFTKNGDWVHSVRLNPGSFEDPKDLISDWTKSDGFGFDTLIYDFIESIPSLSLDGVADHTLDADQLRTKYSRVGEHPHYLKADWKDEVVRDDTLRGYWGWVQARAEAEEDEVPAGSSAPLATVHCIFGKA